MEKRKVSAKKLKDISRMLKRWAKFAKEADDPEHFIEMLQIHGVGLWLEGLVYTEYITIEQYREIVLLCADLTADLLQLEEK